MSTDLNVIKQAYDRHLQRVVDSLDAVLARAEGTEPLYGMAKYHIGLTDQKFKKLPKPKTGKAFRPLLCLLAAEGLSGDIQTALIPATSIEIFHNFSLIHDDIEDHDEKRRGRDTVWKIWGLEHGINSGDALFNLSYTNLENIKDPVLFSEISIKLARAFSEVIEGQYLDIEMAKREINDPWITDSLYSNMIRKKSAELIGVACELGAVVAKSSKEIQKELYEFGINLGLAYQAYDDYAGIWKAENETGKVSYKDIIEKKKSMPVIYAMSKLPDPLAKELKELYDGDRIETIDKVVGLLEQAGAKEYCKTQGLAYKQKALSNLEVVLDTPVFREYKAITDYLIKF